MKAYELIDKLLTVSPSANVVMIGIKGKALVTGIMVTDNDDDVATEVTIIEDEA